jgi:polysaccharide pyruvyl transferase CsaB
MNAPRLLVVGYYGFKNAGDELMLSALLRSIRELRPAARITVMSGDEAETRARHSVETVPYPSADRGERWRNMLKAVAGSDFVLFGGGTFLQDYGFRGWRPISYYLKLVLAARLLGKEVAILGAGVGPLQTGIGRFISRLIVALSHLTVVRDPASLELLRELGFPPGSVTLGADLVAGYSMTTRGARGAGRKRIGVSFFPFYGYVDADEAKQRLMTNQVAKLLLELSGENELYFFCFQEDVDGADNLYANLLAEEYGIPCRKVLFSEGAEPFTDAVAEMDCVIGMRYHFLLLALLAGVPEVCAVAYHPKVTALMREMDLLENAIDLELFSADMVLTMLSMLKGNDSECEAIREYRRRGEANNTALRQLLGVNPA